MKTKKLSFVIVATFLMVVLFAANSMAICEKCSGDDNYCYCSEGSQGMDCVAYATYCTFSGDPCPGGGGCFLAGTMISTITGPKPVEMIGIGDQVISRDENGKNRWVLVENNIRVFKTDYFSINGALEVTGDHPFFVKNQWITTENLKIGDRLIGEDMEEIEIVSIEHFNKGVRAFNIDVLTPDTFFANGILVHNKSIISN